MVDVPRRGLPLWVRKDLATVVVPVLRAGCAMDVDDYGDGVVRRPGDGAEETGPRAGDEGSRRRVCSRYGPIREGYSVWIMGSGKYARDLLLVIRAVPDVVETCRTDRSEVRLSDPCVPVICNDLRSVRVRLVETKRVLIYNASIPRLIEDTWGNPRLKNEPMQLQRPRRISWHVRPSTSGSEIGSLSAHHPPRLTPRIFSDP